LLFLENRAFSRKNSLLADTDFGTAEAIPAANPRKNQQSRRISDGQLFNARSEFEQLVIRDITVECPTREFVLFQR
jgi:hypothetical protein